MPDPIVKPEVNPQLLQAIVSAQTPAQAYTVAQDIVASVPPVAASEDDILESLKDKFGSTPFYKSKKFWVSAVSFALSVCLPALTGSVTWPMGLAGAAGTAAVYVLSQAGVDHGQAVALGQVATQAIISKTGKKA